MNSFRMPLECLSHLRDEMRFTNNENTVSLSESFVRCAIGRDRYFESFLRFPAPLTRVMFSTFLPWQRFTSTAWYNNGDRHDLPQRNTRYWVPGWRREPVKGGIHPSTSTRESRVVKPPILQLRLVLPPYQTETLTCLTGWRWAG